MKNKFIGIIPARYASTRFPGKPLADLGGSPVIEHVYRRAASVLDEVAVATDDSRIYDAVTAFGGKALLTSPSHPSGTDRVMEAYSKSGSEAEVIINIQGDEPFIDPKQIVTLMEAFDNPDVDIATLARKFNPADGFEQLFNANHVKVTFSDSGRALYFSRSIIPYVRGKEWTEWLSSADFFIHVGIYAYRASTLARITKLPQSSLEKAESLEQLRWLQNGFHIHVGLTDSQTIGIDTPDDLERARIFFTTGS